MNSLAHIEINVSNLKLSEAFYSEVLNVLGWKKIDMDSNGISGFKAPDNTHLFLVQTDEKYKKGNFHRKNIGLNHIAFRVNSEEVVDRLSDHLDSATLPKLYHSKPKDYSSEYKTEKYYAVFFEDPDRIKLEVVFIK